MKKFTFLFLLASIVFAKPEPGDVFREYIWFNETGDAGQSVRVGGNNDRTYDYQTKIDSFWVSNVYQPDWSIDLEHAIRAEIIVEKILCHEDTEGLAIELNSNNWVAVPESKNIPEPQSSYQHHFYPEVAIPLDMLKSGKENSFKMRVGTAHPWNWPQNLIYGVHVRIYYDADKKSHPTGKIKRIKNGKKLGTSVPLECKSSTPNGEIVRVDYVGYYTDVNYEGDSEYTQWHYHYLHGELKNHIGSSEKSPFKIDWKTDWIPDQPKPFKIAARIKDETGITYMTESIKNLQFDRSKFSVELCKPYNIPQKWVTRSGEHTEHFDIKGDVDKAAAYQLCWASWSPGYMNGLYINGEKVFDVEGPRYDYYAHRVLIDNANHLKAGKNELKTGKTPLHDGHMVHGMEVEWPGIMVLVKYYKK